MEPDEEPYDIWFRVSCNLQRHGLTQTQNWVAVKELKLSYYIGETLLFTLCTHYGNPKT